MRTVSVEDEAKKAMICVAGRFGSALFYRGEG